MTLAEAPTGATVTVKSIEESPLKQRLMSMGVIPNTKLEILNSSLFGDPIAIRIRSYNLALRRDDAKTILVNMQ